MLRATRQSGQRSTSKSARMHAQGAKLAKSVATNATDGSPRIDAFEVLTDHRQRSHVQTSP